ncbi:MAG: hypothetical protein IJ723_08415, partial [Ruminococcus sp.]|nr:hypothetical protein [Ruminococcus sp.]
VVFEPDLYSEAIGRKAVINATYEDLTNYFTQFSAPTGIPAEVFNDPITKDDLSAASFQLLKDSLSYLTDKNAPKPEITYDFKPFEDSVVGYIESYSEENDIVKDDDYYNLIDNTVSTGEGQIIHHLDIMLLYDLSNSRYGELLHEKSGYVRTVFFASCIALMILLVVMILVDRRHPRDLPYWAGMIIAVTSLVILIPCYYLNKINYFSTFFIRSRHIYLTVTGVFQTMLNMIIYYETIMLVVGLILIILTIIIHMLYKRYRYAKHSREH